jgi:hypothetical protein
MMQARMTHQDDQQRKEEALPAEKPILMVVKVG